MTHFLSQNALKMKWGCQNWGRVLKFTNTNVQMSSAERRGSFSPAPPDATLDSLRENVCFSFWWENHGERKDRRNERGKRGATASKRQNWEVAAFVCVCGREGHPEVQLWSPQAFSKRWLCFSFVDLAPLWGKVEGFKRINWIKSNLHNLTRLISAGLVEDRFGPAQNPVSIPPPYTRMNDSERATCTKFQQYPNPKAPSLAQSRLKMPGVRLIVPVQPCIWWMNVESFVLHWRDQVNVDNTLRLLQRIIMPRCVVRLLGSIRRPDYFPKSLRSQTC